MTAPSPDPAAGRDNRDAVCVLASGGVDSCVLIAEMTRRHAAVVPVFVRQGLRWEAAEIRCLERFLAALDEGGLEALTVLDLPAADLYGDHWSTTGEGVPGAETDDAAVYLPGRNVLLLAKTAVFCALRGIPRIALGVLGANPFPDATPEFFVRMEAALSAALGRPLAILRPFDGLTKREVTQRGRGLPLELSFSCIDPRGDLHCGVCNKCAERKKGFREAGIEDRTAYAEGP